MVDDAGVPGPGRRDLTYDDLELGEQLGSGGNATVHRATLPDGTAVAVKQPDIQGTVARDGAERFLAEAETWADIDDHPNVVGLVDWAATPVPWIAMAYMDGGSLAERLADGPLPPPAAVRVGREVCRAVRHAHRHGVVHLDLKPANVLFRERDGPDVATVADWGLARSLREHAGTVEGLSPRYAAPEQFDPGTYGEPDDFTDIYGLGAVVYAALTGCPPFEGSGVEVLRAVTDGAPTPPSEVNPALLEAVDEPVLRALATAKTDRYETVVDLRRALAGLDLDADGAADASATGTGATDASPATGTSGDAAPTADADPVPAEPVDAVRGIGPTYADRLGEAGVETTADLLAADVSTLADAADAPEGRVEAWRDRARQLHGDAAGSDAGGDPEAPDDGSAESGTDAALDGDLADGPVRGIVTDHTAYDTRPDSYLVDPDGGGTVRVTEPQVVGSVDELDPVAVDIVTIDGEAHATRVQPQDGGLAVAWADLSRPARITVYLLLGLAAGLVAVALLAPGLGWPPLMAPP
jgi:predicted flap endonuclease-1-like 5' DNA nuclease